MLAAVNRIVLALAGLLLLATGAAVLTASWPLAGRHEPLLAEDLRRRHWHAEGWWWALLAGLAVCVVLALWWLLAQLRRNRLAAVEVDTGDGAYALLRGRALEEAVAAEAGSPTAGSSCGADAARPRCGSPWSWSRTRSRPTRSWPSPDRSWTGPGPRRGCASCRPRSG